jgi:hypothetical protein
MIVGIGRDYDHLPALHRDRYRLDSDSSRLCCRRLLGVYDVTQPQLQQRFRPGDPLRFRECIMGREYWHDATN